MSSGAFDDSRDGTGMSVHVPLPGETVEHYLGEVQREHDGVAALVVGKIREGGYGIRFAPDAIDARHAEITREIRSKHKKKYLYGIAVLIREGRLPE